MNASNTIPVLIKGKINYYPFRWVEDTLEIWNGKAWINVYRTHAKNRYGDLIFQPIAAD